MIKRNQQSGGYSLVEMLIYISILAVISTVLINMLLSYTKSYRTLSALRLVEHAGIDSMERMTRDIRGSSSIDTANSTLGSSPGVLTATSTSQTTKFYIHNGALTVSVNGSDVGPLTPSTVTVTSLIFRQLTGTNSSAVKIDLSLSGTVGDVTETKSYHTTVILKAK